MLNYQRVEQLIKLTLFKTAKPIWLWKEGRVPENLWLPFARPGLTDCARLPMEAQKEQSLDKQNLENRYPLVI